MRNANRMIKNFWGPIVCVDKLNQAKIQLNETMTIINNNQLIKPKYYQPQIQNHQQENTKPINFPILKQLLHQMDTRQQQQPNTSSATTTFPTQSLNQQQLSDSLIYNIMKKIQLRETLISEYNNQKQQQNKSVITKYFLHDPVPAYYAVLVLLSKFAKTIYMKQGQTSAIYSIPNTLFHVCVFISINEYYKYKNIFLVGRQQGQEYKIYKRNVQQLMQQKIAGFSVVNKLLKAEWMNPDRLMNIFKYRLVV